MKKRRKGHKVKGKQIQLPEWNYVLRAQQDLDIQLTTLEAVAEKLDEAEAIVPVTSWDFAHRSEGRHSSAVYNESGHPISDLVTLAAKALHRFISEPFAYVCIVRDKGTYFRGVSIRSRKDLFRRGLGYNIAKGRAYKAWYYRANNDIVQKKGELETLRLCDELGLKYKSEVCQSLSNREQGIVDENPSG